MPGGRRRSTSDPDPNVLRHVSSRFLVQSGSNDLKLIDRLANPTQYSQPGRAKLKVDTVQDHYESRLENPTHFTSPGKAKLLHDSVERHFGDLLENPTLFTKQRTPTPPSKWRPRFVESSDDRTSEEVAVNHDLDVVPEDDDTTLTDTMPSPLLNSSIDEDEVTLEGRSDDESEEEKKNESGV